MDLLSDPMYHIIVTCQETAFGSCHRVAERKKEKIPLSRKEPEKVGLPGFIIKLKTNNPFKGSQNLRSQHELAASP